MYFGYSKNKLITSLVISIILVVITLFTSSNFGAIATGFLWFFGFFNEDIIFLLVVIFIIVWIVYSLFEKKV